MTVLALPVTSSLSCCTRLLKSVPARNFLCVSSASVAYHVDLPLPQQIFLPCGFVVWSSTQATGSYVHGNVRTDRLKQAVRFCICLVALHCRQMQLLLTSYVCELIWLLELQRVTTTHACSWAKWVQTSLFLL